jgi:SulP family sulfate permease
MKFENLRGDLYGGVTAAVVALPLALAFGVASGAGPIAGVYGAIFVGFFAAVFGGTACQISGPTGPMTVVMAAIIVQYAHNPALAFTVVMLAGLFQISFGLMRLGRYINLIPYPVISGFMTGIGCIIIILQLAPLFGHSNPAGGTLVAVSAFPNVVTQVDVHALSVGVVALLIVLFLPMRVGRVVPAPVVALLVGVGLTVFLFDGAPVLGDIAAGFPSPQLPVFELSRIADLVKSALVLAFLGSLDSLLTSLIADNITHTHHDSDRELIGQGIGNTVAGLMGAIPGAGATMRTVVNARAGGRTRLSGATHALILLAVMLGLGKYAAYIPHAVLAGILIKVGIDIIDWDYLTRIRHAPRAGVLFMLVVLVLTVFVDLVTAVSVGVILASLLFVKRMSDLQVSSIKAIVEPSDDPSLSDDEVIALERCNGRVQYVHFGGPMSFGAANEMIRKLASTTDRQILIIDLADVPFVDSSAALAVEGIADRAASKKIETLLVGLQPRVREVFVKLGAFKRLREDRCLETRLEAFNLARTLLPDVDGAPSAS